MVRVAPQPPANVGPCESHVKALFVRQPAFPASLLSELWAYNPLEGTHATSLRNFVT